MDAFLECNPSKRQRTIRDDDGDKDNEIKTVQNSWEFILNGSNSVAMFKYHNVPIRNIQHITAFDLDGTLITTKSGKKFSVDKADWKLLFPNILDKLENLYNDGHYLLIITNQNGISQGHATMSDLQQKLDNILSKLKVPTDIICAFEKDVYRKPLTGSWNYMLQRRCPEMLPHPEFSTRCLYVGDAAGRPKSGTKPKDFSAVDFKLALNANIQVSEYYFNVLPESNVT